jgi:hypothetical protein
MYRYIHRHEYSWTSHLTTQTWQTDSDISMNILLGIHPTTHMPNVQIHTCALWYILWGAHPTPHTWCTDTYICIMIYTYFEELIPHRSHDAQIHTYALWYIHTWGAHPIHIKIQHDTYFEKVLPNTYTIHTHAKYLLWGVQPAIHPHSGGRDR